MAEYAVNLDNSERDAVTIALAGKTFRIVRVVTGIYQLWTAFLKEEAEYLGKVQEYEKVLGESPARAQEIIAEVEAYAGRKIDALLRVIELLVSKNGVPFDREWWLGSADERDYRDFIAAALSPAKGTKKKSEEGP